MLPAAPRKAPGSPDLLQLSVQGTSPSGSWRMVLVKVVAGGFRWKGILEGKYTLHSTRLPAGVLRFPLPSFSSFSSSPPHPPHPLLPPLSSLPLSSFSSSSPSPLPTPTTSAHSVLRSGIPRPSRPTVLGSIPPSGRPIMLQTLGPWDVSLHLSGP